MRMGVQVAFRLLVAHVEEGAACNWPEDKSEMHLRSIADSISGSIKSDQLLNLRLEDIFAHDESAENDRQALRDRLTALIKVSAILTTLESHSTCFSPPSLNASNDQARCWSPLKPAAAMPGCP